MPRDRPLFVCKSCNSANIYISFCPWCRWTSTAAADAFEGALRRRKRNTVSSPQLRHTTHHSPRRPHSHTRSHTCPNSRTTIATGSPKRSVDVAREPFSWTRSWTRRSKKSDDRRTLPRLPSPDLRPRISAGTLRLVPPYLLSPLPLPEVNNHTQTRSDPARPLSPRLISLPPSPPPHYAALGSSPGSSPRPYLSRKPLLSSRSHESTYTLPYVHPSSIPSCSPHGPSTSTSPTNNPPNHTHVHPSSHDSTPYEHDQPQQHNDQPTYPSRYPVMPDTLLHLFNPIDPLTGSPITRPSPTSLPGPGPSSPVSSQSHQSCLSPAGNGNGTEQPSLLPPLYIPGCNHPYKASSPTSEKSTSSSFFAKLRGATTPTVSFSSMSLSMSTLGRRPGSGSGELKMKVRKLKDVMFRSRARSGSV